MMKENLRKTFIAKCTGAVRSRKVLSIAKKNKYLSPFQNRRKVGNDSVRGNRKTEESLISLEPGSIC